MSTQIFKIGALVFKVSEKQVGKYSDTVYMIKVSSRLDLSPSLKEKIATLSGEYETLEEAYENILVFLHDNKGETSHD